MKITKKMLDRALNIYAEKRNPERWDGPPWGESGKMNHEAAIQAVLEVIFKDYNLVKDKNFEPREQNSKLLEDAGIPFEIKNAGKHLIVEGFNCFIDFWPGTGKWISRDGKSGFGVKNLIRCIKNGAINE